LTINRFQGVVTFLANTLADRHMNCLRKVTELSDSEDDQNDAMAWLCAAGEITGIASDLQIRQQYDAAIIAWRPTPKQESTT
jgi:hypothetical protein